MKNKYSYMESPYYTSEVVRDKINDILKEVAAIDTEFGTDLTKAEKKALKDKQRDLLRKIKPLDVDYYNLLTAFEGQRRTTSLMDWFAINRDSFD